MGDNIAMIISSCEKYSDLWGENVWLLNQNWPDRNIETAIVTDCAHENSFENINIFSAGENMEMPQRILSYIETVDSDYILYCQDDYFLTKRISTKAIFDLICEMRELQLDYLRLYPYPKSSKKVDGYDHLCWLRLDRTYDVNMYPGIWRKEFLTSAFNRDVDIWHLEASLTRYAVETGARCALCKEEVFPFLDVLEKGKVHYKASQYLHRRGILLERSYMTLPEEIKHQIEFYSRSLVPKPVFVIIKKTLKLCGKNFYSDLY